MQIKERQETGNSKLRGTAAKGEASLSLHLHQAKVDRVRL